MSQASKDKKEIELFYSYSHNDEDLRKDLEKHLSVLKTMGMITNWHSQKIGAGKAWESEIASHLDSADIILLLISSDFLASDYCNNVEVKRALERHQQGEARVIPIILRPVVWQLMPFGKFQALPESDKPITKWKNRDEAFKKVAEGIMQVVDELKVRHSPRTAKIPADENVAKIVIIEDDIKWRTRLQNVLRAENYAIESHEHYSIELLERVKSHDYDLLISDISLGANEQSKEGVNLVKSARESNQHLPIIVITGYEYDDVYEVIDPLVDSKIDNFIAKSNWDAAKFVEAVKKSMQEGRDRR